MPNRPQTKMFKVLCFYKAWNKEGNMWNDSIMIQVARSSEIPEALKWALSRRVHRWTEFCVNPKPGVYEFLSYLPETGTKTFDEAYALRKPGSKLCLRVAASDSFFQ